MNALVVYDSKYGDTEQVARSIAAALGEYGRTRVVSVEEMGSHQVEDLDLLVVGSPTQRWRMTPAVQSFLNHLPPETCAGLPVATFDTRYRSSVLLTGSAARRIAKELTARSCVLLLPAESFFVAGREGPLMEGEIERAAQWARVLHEKYTAVRSRSSEGLARVA